MRFLLKWALIYHLVIGGFMTAKLCYWYVLYGPLRPVYPCSARTIDSVQDPKKIRLW